MSYEETYEHVPLHFQIDLAIASAPTVGISMHLILFRRDFLWMSLAGYGVQGNVP
ncbi:unnamed protein product, partial [Didymodactylos carnosus]